MKKVFFSLSLILVTFFLTPPKVAAISVTDVQQMINTSIAPLQTAITNLQSSVQTILTRLTATESNISGIFIRLANLENVSGLDFNLPQTWQTTASATLQTITIKPTKNVVSLSCSWNGIILTQNAQIRGIAHLPDKDYYVVSTCDGVTFSNISSFPATGTVIPVDLYVFWQGKEKKAAVNVTAP